MGWDFYLILQKVDAHEGRHACIAQARSYDWAPWNDYFAQWNYPRGACYAEGFLPG